MHKHIASPAKTGLSSSKSIIGGAKELGMMSETKAHDTVAFNAAAVNRGVVSGLVDRPDGKSAPDLPESDAVWLTPPHTPPSEVTDSVPVSVPQSRTLLRATMAGRFGNMTLVNSNRLGQMYQLRVTFPGTLLTSAAGVLSTNIVANPASLPFSEWTTFAGLFDEVKLVSLVVDAYVYDPLALSTGQAICISGSFASYATAVTSTAQLANAGNSRLVPTVMTSNKLHRISLVGRDLNWAPTASPTPGPYAGCPGSVQLYGTGFTVSTSVGSSLSVLILLLRGRL